jgi:hypothetical protein
VGSFLFSGIIFTSLSKLLAGAPLHFERFAFSFALFVTTLFVNITESTFIRGDHHLWLVFLLTVITGTSSADESSEAELSPDAAEAQFSHAEGAMGTANQ